MSLSSIERARNLRESRKRVQRQLAASENPDFRLSHVTSKPPGLLGRMIWSLDGADDEDRNRALSTTLASVGSSPEAARIIRESLRVLLPCDFLPPDPLSTGSRWSDLLTCAFCGLQTREWKCANLRHSECVCRECWPRYAKVSSVGAPSEGAAVPSPVSPVRRRYILYPYAS